MRGSLRPQPEGGPWAALQHRRSPPASVSPSTRRRSGSSSTWECRSLPHGPSTSSSGAARTWTANAAWRGFRERSSSSAWQRRPAPCCWPRATPPTTSCWASDRPLVCCADGEGTLIADDATGAVRDATVADLRDVCRLYDALPEIDFLWTSLSAPSLDPETAPLAVDAIALRESSKHLQSVSPKAPHLVPRLVGHAGGGGRRLARRAPDLLVPALHGGAAATRSRRHRREPRPGGQRRHDLPRPPCRRWGRRRR